MTQVNQRLKLEDFEEIILEILMGLTRKSS